MLETSPRGQWFEDVGFWEHFAPIMFDKAHWSEVPAVADAVTHLSNFNLYGETPSESWKEPLESAPKVLDLCCGLGRMSSEFARMGFSVTGVDITESFLQTAKEDAKYENLDIEYIKADAREFVRPDYFDTVVNLYISFGYFEEKKDDLKVLQNAYKSLKKDGTFIIETQGKELISRDFIEAEWFERAGGFMLTEYECIDAWSLLKNRWILIKEGKVVERTFVQRLYSASELRELLEQAGFKKIDIYGDWNMIPYNHLANKLIAVCGK